MNYKNARKGIATLLLTSMFMFNANASPYVFNFTGECDDCAFSGNPTDIGFDPLNDGLTQSVSATLTLTDASIGSDGFLHVGVGDAIFTYNGSSLINSFTMFDPYTFTSGLLPTGQVQTGSSFKISSSANAANPDISFDFPNFCTALGEAVLDVDGCYRVGQVSFELDSLGNFSVSGTRAFDIGGDGQLTPVSAVPAPTAIWLFGTALLGFIGVARRKKVA